MQGTVEQLAKEAGLRQYDIAVPWDWMKEGIRLTGLPMGIVVWCYDCDGDCIGGIFGHPVALDEDGRKFLAEYYARWKDRREA